MSTRNGAGETLICEIKRTTGWSERDVCAVLEVRERGSPAAPARQSAGPKLEEEEDVGANRGSASLSFCHPERGIQRKELYGRELALPLWAS